MESEYGKNAQKNGKSTPPNVNTWESSNCICRPTGSLQKDVSLWPQGRYNT